MKWGAKPFSWVSALLVCLSCTFDVARADELDPAVLNSEHNLANPDPSQAIRWGQQTWDEMMIGWHDVAVPLKR